MSSVAAASPAYPPVATRSAAIPSQTWALTSRIDADSLEEAAEQMRPWAYEYTHLEPGPAGMHGFILQLGPVLVGRWSGSLAKVIRGPVPAGKVALIAATRGSARVGTTYVAPGSGVLAGPGAELNAYTSRHFESVSIALNQDYWRELLAAKGIDLDIANAQTRLMPAPAFDVDRLRTLTQAIANAAESAPAEFTTAGRIAALEDEVIRAAASAIGWLQAWDKPAERSAMARHRAAARARDFIDSNLDRPLSLTEICSVAYCSARALEYAFLEMFGVTPIAYVRFARLSAVRRALSGDAGTRLSVTDVATSLGFWHLGQFARDYRALFGELPSATLALARARFQS